MADPVRGPALLAAALACALVLAACGGDGDAGSGDATQPAGAAGEEYSAAVDQACAELDRANTEAAQQATGEGLEPSEVGDEILRLTRENSQTFRETIAGLEPLGELADEHEAIVEAVNAKPPSDPEALAAGYEDQAEKFAAVGAQTCVAGIEQAQQSLEDALPDSSG